MSGPLFSVDSRSHHRRINVNRFIQFIVTADSGYFAKCSKQKNLWFDIKRVTFLFSNRKFPHQHLIFSLRSCHHVPKNEKKKKNVEKSTILMIAWFLIENKLYIHNLYFIFEVMHQFMLSLNQLSDSHTRKKIKIHDKSSM